VMIDPYLQFFVCFVGALYFLGMFIVMHASEKTLLKRGVSPLYVYVILPLFWPYLTALAVVALFRKDQDQ